MLHQLIILPVITSKKRPYSQFLAQPNELRYALFGWFHPHILGKWLANRNILRYPPILGEWVFLPNVTKRVFRIFTTKRLFLARTLEGGRGNIPS